MPHKVVTMTRVVRRRRRRQRGGFLPLAALLPVLKMVGKSAVKKAGRSLAKGAGKKVAKSLARGAAGAVGNFATQKLLQKVFKSKKKAK